ncbi:hypothetical protein HNQ96_005077 [Aminobacter lissarensis]|uniref:Uncharacterized protein n=1 Tax=Aminobacter carboxidus TaxID=376165 RepID=A0A8E1WIQ4_9HYPH|nr:hypothetical protein [Aminobacter lissarensis]
MITPYDTYSIAHVHTMWKRDITKSCGNGMCFRRSRGRMASSWRDRTEVLLLASSLSGRFSFLA